MSDPDLIDAYCKQLQRLGNPAAVHLAWAGQDGVDPADLATAYRQITGQEPPQADGDPKAAARRLADLAFKGLT